MINPNEKNEILRSCASPARRRTFRKAKASNALPTFDDYLRFLDKVCTAFNHAAKDVQQSAGSSFKL